MVEIFDLSMLNSALTLGLSGAWRFWSSFRFWENFPWGGSQPMYVRASGSDLCCVFQCFVARTREGKFLGLQMKPHISKLNMISSA